jgi:hypothetical protein
MSQPDQQSASNITRRQWMGWLPLPAVAAALGSVFFGARNLRAATTSAPQGPVPLSMPNQILVFGTASFGQGDPGWNLDTTPSGASSVPRSCTKTIHFPAPAPGTRVQNVSAAISSIASQGFMNGGTGMLYLTVSTGNVTQQSFDLTVTVKGANRTYGVSVSYLVLGLAPIPMP